MKIDKQNITKIKLTELKALDPVTVFIEDHEAGKGELTFKCYGKSWSYYWGGMGCNSVIEFFLSCNDDYIANCMWDHSKSQTEFDSDKLGLLVKAQIISYRRDNCIEKDFAREMFDVDSWEEYMPQHSYDDWHCPMFCDEDFFKEFGESCLNNIDIPRCASSDYKYLLRIVAAIREAFVTMKLPIAA